MVGQFSYSKATSSNGLRFVDFLMAPYIDVFSNMGQQKSDLLLQCVRFQTSARTTTLPMIRLRLSIANSARPAHTENLIFAKQIIKDSRRVSC